MSAATLTTLSTTPNLHHHNNGGPPPSSRPSGLSRLRKTTGFGGISTASTPNLNALYSAHSFQSSSSRLAPPSLSRKASFTALTSGSLAAIPDATETYAINTVLLSDNASSAAPPPVPPLFSGGGGHALRSVSSVAALSSAANRQQHHHMMAPLTPGRSASGGFMGRPGSGSGPGSGGTSNNISVEDLSVGDTVDVPGSMYGTVRFIGTVAGRKGTFAGVELHSDYASRGKNNGDVDGVSYFTTTNAGAGIFLPLTKAVRRDSPPTSAASSFPLTPTMGGTGGGGLKMGNQNSTNFTPPTPSLQQKFSQSMGPGFQASSAAAGGAGGGGRAASPSGKKAPRMSLPRPDSPVRRLQLSAPSRPSMAATPGPPNGTAQAKTPARYGSPTANKFGQSVRGTAGDPSKKFGQRGGLERKDSAGGGGGARSTSALGMSSGYEDDDATPVGPLAGPRRTKTNGSVGSINSFNLKMRPGSRTNGAGGGMNGAGNDDEVDRLRTQLDDRDRQLRDQASTLAEMESSLTELQTLMENADGPPPPGVGRGALRRGNSNSSVALALAQRDQADDLPRDVAQLRSLLREKNDKIAMLTAEFDAHRADFRSTIDTLEMASTETQNLYEKRIAELEQEIRDLATAAANGGGDGGGALGPSQRAAYEKRVAELEQELRELADRTEDVDNVAAQLKQLEELVQELEEGLEDARRGEAEARGEVEFLRGEVERTRSELRREREKAAAASVTNMMNGGGAAMMTNGLDKRASAASSKELEQKEDEIRGLKAIIHSLSRDSVPESPDKTPTSAVGGAAKTAAHKRAQESIDARMARERLEREVAELRALVDAKQGREDELEREVESLRRISYVSIAAPAGKGQRSSLRDSRGTVILAPRGGVDHSAGNRSPDAPTHLAAQANGNVNGAMPKGRERGHTLDTMAESDAYSTATENSTLWCEICETSGHDILTCTNMFGPQAGSSSNTAAAPPATNAAKAGSPGMLHTGKDVVREGLLRGLNGGGNIDPHHLHHHHQYGGVGEVPKPAPLSPVKQKPAVPAKPTNYSAAPPSPMAPPAVPVATTTTVRILPNPMDSGPVAGKDSGVVDLGKWCALCERDGHDSVDCPFEDAF